MKRYADAETLQAAERMCPLDLSWCADLSKHDRDNGELSPARDLAERTCQYGDRFSCRELGKQYCNGVFREPVRVAVGLLAWL